MPDNYLLKHICLDRYRIIYPGANSLCSVCGRGPRKREPLTPLCLGGESGGLSVLPFFCHAAPSWVEMPDEQEIDQLDYIHGAGTAAACY